MLSPSSQWTLTVADPSLDTPINVPFFDVVLCLQLPPTRSPGSNPPIRTKLGHTYNYKLHILLLHRNVYYTDPRYLIWHIYRKEILKTNFDTRQLYLDLPEMNWFTVTYFGDYALSIPVFYHNYMANSSSQWEIFVTMRLLQTLWIISCVWMKVGLQHKVWYRNLCSTFPTCGY